MNPLKSIIKSYLNAEDADREKETGMTFRRTVYDAEKWVRHRSSRRHQRNLLSIGSSRVILALGPPVFAITCLATVMAALNEAVILGLLPKWWPILHMSALPFQLTAPALALLLVFRTNASYARFDEARRLWANVVVRTRETIRMALAWIVNPVDFARRQQLLAHVVAFSMCLKHHLTKCETLREELSGVLEPWEVNRVMAARHKPNYVLQQLAEIVPALDMTDKQKEIMDKNLTHLNECTGACERIYSTPIPLSYTRLTSRFLVIWHATLPLGLWDQCKWAVIPATFFSAAALLCIEEVGVLIEEPFSILALSSFCGEAREALNDLLEAHEVINSPRDGFSDTDAGSNAPFTNPPATSLPASYPSPFSARTSQSHPATSASSTKSHPASLSSVKSSLNGRSPPSVNVTSPQQDPTTAPLPAHAPSLLSRDEDANRRENNVGGNASPSTQTDANDKRGVNNSRSSCAYAGTFTDIDIDSDMDRHNPSSDPDRNGSLAGGVLRNEECCTGTGIGDTRSSMILGDESLDPCSVSGQISPSIASLGSATAASCAAPGETSFSGSDGPGAPWIRTLNHSSSSVPPPFKAGMPMPILSKKRRRKGRPRRPPGRVWFALR